MTTRLGWACPCSSLCWRIDFAHDIIFQFKSLELELELEDDVVGGVGGRDVVDPARQDHVKGLLHLGVLVEEGGVHVVDLAPDDAVEIHVEVWLVL